MDRLALQRPPKRPVEQGLEEVLRLALGFALLGAQTLETVNDLGKACLYKVSFTSPQNPSRPLPRSPCALQGASIADNARPGAAAAQ